MSTARVIPRAKKVPLGRMERGPNGRRLCRQCSKEVPRGRLTFCSPACVHEWNVRANPGYAREHVYRRDRGRCGRCGLDTVRLKQEYDRLVKIVRGLAAEHGLRLPPSPVMRYEYRPPALQVLYTDLGSWTHLWEMHHKVPVVEGGGECGLDGLMTLCRWCHNDETAELARRRAEAKRAQAQLELAGIPD